MAGNMVLIDPYLAQRDVDRVQAAIQKLNDIESAYNSLIAEIDADYKGPAAEELKEVIRSRITSSQYGTKAMKIELKSAKSIISNAIKVFKSYDDNMLNLMK